MTRYDLVMFSFGGLIRSSNLDMLQWAENELRRRYPRYVYRSGHVVGLMSDSRKFDDRADREFRKVTEGRDSVMWELLTQLLHQGWEPFVADGGVVWLRWQQSN